MHFAYLRGFVIFSFLCIKKAHLSWLGGVSSISGTLSIECVGNHFRPQNNCAYIYYIIFLAIRYYLFSFLSIMNSLILPLYKRLLILLSCISCIVDT